VRSLYNARKYLTQQRTKNVQKKVSLPAKQLARKFGGNNKMLLLSRVRKGSKVRILCIGKGKHTKCSRKAADKLYVVCKAAP